MADTLSRDLSTISLAEQPSETFEGGNESLVPSQNASDEPYVYKPLQPDEIRLLEAVKEDGLITYPWKHVSLDSAPTYTALSYCWGDPTPNQTFVCDNLSLPITDSVKVLLPYLASKHGNNLFWIDAVCLYADQHEAEYHQNLRFGPLFPG